MADRHGEVGLVGLCLEGRLDELVARELLDHRQHALVTDALRAQALDELGAGGSGGRSGPGGGLRMHQLSIQARRLSSAECLVRSTSSGVTDT